MQIHVSPKGGGAAVVLTVRPWFDTVEDLQAKAFASDTPEQRQQLFLDGKQLQEDGRVLAQHGVVAETTIQLVSQCTSECNSPNRLLYGQVSLDSSVASREDTCPYSNELFTVLQGACNNIWFVDTCTGHT